jgi:hypothetical protein
VRINVGNKRRHRGHTEDASVVEYSDMEPEIVLKPVLTEAIVVSTAKPKIWVSRQNIFIVKKRK